MRTIHERIQVIPLTNLKKKNLAVNLLIMICTRFGASFISQFTSYKYAIQTGTHVDAERRD